MKCLMNIYLVWKKVVVGINKPYVINLKCKI